MQSELRALAEQAGRRLKIAATFAMQKQSTERDLERASQWAAVVTALLALAEQVQQ